MEKEQVDPLVLKDPSDRLREVMRALEAWTCQHKECNKWRGASYISSCPKCRLRARTAKAVCGLLQAVEQ